MSVLEGKPAVLSWEILLNIVGKSGPGVYWSFPVIAKILTHLGLSTRAPPRTPARRVYLFQTI
jgi:hypothetical protein